MKKIVPILTVAALVGAVATAGAVARPAQERNIVQTVVAAGTFKT